MTVGQTVQIAYTENAFDAAGEALAAGFVNTSLAAPTFTVTVSDALGLSTVRQYSGVGTGPITWTAQTPNYASATATLASTPAAPFTPGYALDYQNGFGPVPCDVRVYAPDGSSPARHYSIPCSGPATNGPGVPRFDPNGTLWGVAPVGINPDGTAAAKSAPAGTLLTFDLNGNAYVADPTTPALDVYNSGGTEVRTINLSAVPSAAAVDPAGHVYVLIAQSGIFEYPASGSGNLQPIASNTTANIGAPVTDGAGNVYAFYAGAMGEWPAGTFGSSAPGRTLSLPLSNSFGSFQFGADQSGDIYAVPEVESGTWTYIYYVSAGSSSFTQLPVGYTFEVFAPYIGVAL